MNSILTVLLFLISLSAIAQDKASDIDPFDVSSTAEQAKDLGISTISEVDDLEDSARKLFLSGNCTEAMPVLEEYAKQANWIANLISSGLAPYYGASYDDRENYHDGEPYSELQKLVQYEKVSNEYKRKRNIAIAMQGECYAKSGDKERAVSYLVKALELFDIDTVRWWKRTRNNLYDLIELK